MKAINSHKIVDIHSFFRGAAMMLMMVILILMLLLMMRGVMGSNAVFTKIIQNLTDSHIRVLLPN